MGLRKLALMALLFCGGYAYAEELTINPSHPEQYMVQKGDTLWELSGKFLEHPWQWPELWRYNSQIKNPHLIYPGDTVYFSMVDGRPQLNLSRGSLYQQAQMLPKSSCVLREQDYQQGRKEFATASDGKLLPCIREQKLDAAIKLIPVENIASYLSSPKVVDEQELDNAPHVVDFAGEHLIAGAGDRIYVSSITGHVGESFMLYRPGNAYISPETGSVLGYEAQFVANATMLQTGDPATLAITKAVGEIRKGDRIMSDIEQDISLNYFPRPPEKMLRGHIIGVLGGVSQIGRHNVVVVDKGTADGMQVGHEFTIKKAGKQIRDTFSDSTDKTVVLPDEVAGNLMIFRPFEHVSYALVMKATQAIHVLDKVHTP